MSGRPERAYRVYAAFKGGLQELGEVKARDRAEAIKLLAVGDGPFVAIATRHLVLTSRFGTPLL